jgi:glyoxylase-like metal-dependent hydrolase (beta-lactamase superfamily II)
MKMTQSGTNFARYEVGDLIVVALRDGYVDMPPSRLRQEGNRPFDAELPEQVRLVNGQLRLSVNAFLVIERGQHTLIDTGAGNAWLPTMGLLHRALAEAGIAHEDISAVALTHTHMDHVHGLLAADGSTAFPNLERIFVPREEISLFDRGGPLARFRSQCTLFDDGFRLRNSMTAFQAHGHEVGHTAFEVTWGDGTLVVWGDVVHVPSIQFARPELTWEYDADQQQARATRERLLERAARPGVFVAGAHLDFPGVGRVERADAGYQFSPV